MSLNESIVEEAALEWFGEQSRVAPTLIPAFSQGEKESVGHGPQLAPGEHAGGTLTPALSHGERESYGEVVLVGRLRDAIRRLNPAIPEEARAAIRQFRRVQTERSETP